MRVNSLSTGVFMLILTTAVAQVPIDTEMKLESIAEFADDEGIDLMQLAENLELLTENRININNTDKEALSLLPFLNAFQVHNILQYIKRYGPIVHPYELTAIRTIDQRTAMLLMDYVYFGQSAKTAFRFKDAVKHTRQN
ncbi:MAG: helix-hairpin-helix domain-containing protein, partial [Cryomorphaceae bacterium]|nr:helix-hairpin-helix domain-containing protein [Cryomorphaceae bacterium]